MCKAKQNSDVGSTSDECQGFYTVCKAHGHQSLGYGSQDEKWVLYYH